MSFMSNDWHMIIIPRSRVSFDWHTWLSAVCRITTDTDITIAYLMHSTFIKSYSHIISQLTAHFFTARCYAWRRSCCRKMSIRTSVCPCDCLATNVRSICSSYQFQGLSVTRQYSVGTAKHILKVFSPSGIATSVGATAPRCDAGAGWVCEWHGRVWRGRRGGVCSCNVELCSGMIIIIIIFYLPKKEAGYQKSRSSSYAGRPLYNDS